MTIDCSLDNFKYPGLPTYGINFGVKKTSGEGLSTAECCDDMAMPFNRQRPYIVTETSETTEIEAHSTFRITASGITLTIADAAFDGCRAVVINASTGDITVKGGVSGLNGGAAALTLAAKEIAYLIYYSGWQTAFITYGGHLSAPNAADKATQLVRKQEHDEDIVAAKNLENATGTLAISNGGTGATSAQKAANATVGAVKVNTKTTDSEYIVKASGSTVGRMTMANFWSFLSNKVKALKVNNAVQADYATQAGKVIPPVGFVYVQFKGQADPNTLFGGGTWQNISSSFAGEFFRSEGGNAAAFGSSQTQSTQPHTHSWSFTSTHRHGILVAGVQGNTGLDKPNSNAFAGTPQSSFYPGTTNSGSAYTQYITDTKISKSGTTGSYGATETRPVNSTIRIWKRTA